MFIGIVLGLKRIYINTTRVRVTNTRMPAVIYEWIESPFRFISNMFAYEWVRALFL